MTIVGLERQLDDQRVLLVLDPAFRGSSVVKRFSGKALLTEDSMADRLLKPYRRNINRLRKHNEFEVLYLEPVQST
ncbi:hypothetical protein PT974_06574 [Cladobotryum mycophilum]|uniref:Uncharacterized protein n=1 Tax=Cladobotryum mycophilum TaxID=491253 RepID=A0ABR0SLT9_9HYPO